ncbi:MAG TPA: hypothetical protein VEL02_09085, partial [Jatrophihabitantaceae bacterium]|nr:hypothetical protein [Jatrophihabitantaceae bacterium]
MTLKKGIASGNLVPFVTAGVLALSIVAVCSRYVLKAHDLRNKEYGEGTVLAMIERLRHERPSMAWVERPPYTLSNYGPGFYAVARAAGGLTRRPVSLVPQRYVALIATLTAAALIGAVAARKTREPVIGAMCALIFLVAPVVDGWVPWGRVDMLGVVLGLAAYVALDSTSVRLAIPTAAAFVTAGSLVKPTEALAAVPLFLYLLVRNRKRDAAAFALLVSVFGAAAWAAVVWQSQGFYFWTVFRSNLPGFSPWWGFEQTYRFLASPLMVAALLSLAHAAVRAPATVLESPYPFGFILSTALSALMASREGSNFNYFLGPAALASIVIGVCGVNGLVSLHRPRAFAAIASAAAVITLPAVYDLPARLPADRPAGYQHIERLLAQRRDREQLVLADGRWIDAVLAAGYQPIVNDAYLFRTLVD